MPFPEQHPLVFSRESILTLLPGQTGCYGIFNASGGALYVGRSNDIRDRLLGHVGEPLLTVLGVSLLTEVGHWPQYDSYGRERTLILEYRPWLNQRVG